MLFSLSLKYFPISYVIIFCLMGYLEMCYLISKHLRIFKCILLIWFVISFNYGQISLLKFIETCFMDQNAASWWMFHAHLKRICILICSGCCNKTPQAGWLTNNRNLLPTVLGVGSPRSGCWRSRVLVKALLHVADFPLLAVSSRGGRGRGAFSGLLYGVVNPIHKGSALMAHSPSKRPTT